ncbi:hypothetical protein SISNIDRAFT_449824 [Sistotremastrum niveocremeum HHB9708]|uniref:F-box domain-containing protein n=1 Tax=Sistotremastrum niveocremeum HHB9708 TaxID=1314777 RepID=A0A164YP43_9AGAM|nr:hypothetical protein SISNIDRAFT_449824 [Sistotremastrum niveocremeum HHB9708]
MSLPVELYGRIAEYIRSPPIRAYWNREEDQTLADLSLVSKTWRAEAKRALWSTICIVSHPGDVYRLTQQFGVLLDKNYARYVRHLVLEVGCIEHSRGYDDPDFPLKSWIESAIPQMLSMETVLIDYVANDVRLDTLLSVYRAVYPRLNRLEVGLYFHQAFPPVGIGLDQFLLHHSRLRHLRLEVSGAGIDRQRYSVPWRALRQSCTFDRLATFMGGLEEAKMLNSDWPVFDVQIILDDTPGVRQDRRRFFKDIMEFDGPMPRVRTLGFTYATVPLLDLQTLDALSFTFPNLIELSGLNLSSAFVTYILNIDSQNSKSHLVDLRHLRIAGEEWDRHSFDRATMEQTMTNLPRLFPSLHSATFFTESPRRYLHFRFGDGGLTISRDINIAC